MARFSLLAVAVLATLDISSPRHLTGIGSPALSRVTATRTRFASHAVPHPDPPAASTEQR
ncbi:hypothetical protein [Saccharothrix coeruleofusca]|uniref:Uncharacterized protein n=1 Tax=Saccharothrix coeruleofusca TaxID=33919 RepID=A0A918EEH3_9PSEU|nr:hypothetical protein [Saccharothrix coeruleofusca]GGP65909.1 hypothetical protein GCM10010185_43110 [Saccharothrix coeruleofusca]